MDDTHSAVGVMQLQDDSDKCKQVDEIDRYGKENNYLI